MSPATWPFTTEKLAARLRLITAHVHRRSCPLPDFRMRELDGAMVDVPADTDPACWQDIPPNSYWGKADLDFVMQSEFRVPDGWNAAHIALHLPLGVLGDIFNHPEALVSVDGAPIGSADRYHHTIALGSDLADGQSHQLSLHGWTGLSGWPPDPDCKARLFMGSPQLVERDPSLLAFCQIAGAALDSLRHLDPDGREHAALLSGLDRAFGALDTRDPVGDALYQSCPAAQAMLEQAIAEAGPPMDVTLHAIGHAHMDIAYLWPISQIRLKNARTYSNVLRLMEANPDYRFSHSQPQLYAMVEEDYPALFDQIKSRIAEGRWEVIGGMWVEPDLNLPGAEALIRQLTLGRRYFSDRFGEVETPVLWLPDTFGFPAQVPQLMQLAGLRWFATNKLNWNQYNQVPSSTHHWEGLDGSRVLAHVLTTPRDVQYLPFPTNYKSDLSAAEVMGTWTRSTARDHIRHLPICFGYGDGGGGPTEDLIAKAKAYRAMPGMPRVEMSTVRRVFERMEEGADNLPVWSGEHYMEGHRGVYTSQGWIKRANRKAEWALHEAEALAAMAGQSPDLDAAWRLLCLNQFHDIITGTSIGQVFDDARRDYEKIAQIVEAASRSAATALALDTPGIANTSPVSGPRLALLPHGATDAGQVVDTGALALFDNLPGYAVVPISAAKRPTDGVTARPENGGFVLENPYLRASINDRGQLKSVFDKVAGYEVLAANALGNTLIAFEDRPICWDAWDIDASYEDHQEVIGGPAECSIVETGPLRATLEIETRWQSSTIRQRIQLAAHSARLDFVTEVDWHETHTLLKAAFPTRLRPEAAVFDIQWGQIRRPVTRDTAFDAARFEVPAHKWAQISEGARAVALLNDCKYGYDVLDGTLRITLIKSATSPDPHADQGHHQFTYALLPCPADRPDIRDREAYDLNAPLRYLPMQASSHRQPASFVGAQDTGAIVETLKPADDGNGQILRVFEARGRPVTTSLTFGQAVHAASVTSIFEVDEGALPVAGNAVEIVLRPFQILSIRVVFQR